MAKSLLRNKQLPVTQRPEDNPRGTCRSKATEIEAEEKRRANQNTYSTPGGPGYEKEMHISKTKKKRLKR
jgi:hypothetical protein